jgi:hypothetical protein
MSRGGWVSLLAGLFAFILYVGCAEVAPPPGGQPDTYGPTLVSSIPDNGAVNVAPGDLIILRFSERVVQPPTGRAAFISPRPAREPKLKWKGDRLEIRLPEKFRPDETYIVSLATAITDLRGNKLDSATSIAFSTGATIDSGEIRGRVYAADQPRAGIMAALYELSVFEDSAAVIDSLWPRYAGQTSKDGEFVFQYLPFREYRLIAFEDRNRNERFNPAREQFALPDRRIVVGGPLPLDDLQLFLTSQDTVVSEVISASFTPDGLVKVRLSRTVPLDLLMSSPGNLMLKSQADSTHVHAARVCLEFGQESTSVLNCYHGWIGEGSYNLELTYDVTRPALHYRGIEVKPMADKNPPAIVEFQPDNVPQLLEDVRIRTTFSEPLDTTAITAGTFVLQEAGGEMVPLILNWEDVFRLRLLPEKLREGQAYKVAVTEFELVDLAGNILGDSLLEYPFSIIDLDSLGVISGSITVNIPGEESSPVNLSFQRIGSAQRYETTAKGRSFSIDVPAGKYLLSGFIDSDLDGHKGKGSIYPFRLGEPSSSYPDTISVRARFETMGIEIQFR